VVKGEPNMVSWGIIGCGSVTEVKSGPAFSRVEGSTLVAVMRRRRELAEDYARRHGVSRATDDADDILKADDIDAVYIATHPDTHAEYATRAAAEGKAVYVEKPMATTVAECEQMIDVCRAAGVPLWVGYYRRRLPRFLAVRDLLAEAAIGAVRGCTILRYQPLADERPWQFDASRSGGGLFFDSACHAFDMLDFLLGPIGEVTGAAATLGGEYAVEDTVSASFRLGNGGVGSGFWCYAAGESLDRVTLHGSRGRLSFSVQYADPIMLEIGGAVREIGVPDPPHVHEPLIASIVGELNGTDTCPSTPESALRTAKVMEQVLATYWARTLA